VSWRKPADRHGRRALAVSRELNLKAPARIIREGFDSRAFFWRTLP
jgi:hypothetical protein